MKMKIYFVGVIHCQEFYQKY